MMLRLTIAALLAFAALGCKSNKPPPGEPAVSRTATPVKATPPETVTDTVAAPAKATPPKAVTDTAAEPAKSAAAATTCQLAPNSSVRLDVPEASASTWIPGKSPTEPNILVIADSGNKGAYVVVDAKGQIQSKGSLSLGDNYSDDIEGAAYMDDKIYTLTSGGFVRTYNGSLAKTDGPYAISDLDEWVCAPKRGNCKKDYEGLCLVTHSAAGKHCVGYAASRATGELVCVQLVQGKLRIDPTAAKKIVGKGVLAGCDIAPDNASVWITTNVLDGNQLFQIPLDPTSAAFGRSGLGEPQRRFGKNLGFVESVVVTQQGNAIRFHDSSASPSLMDRIDCSAR